MKSLNILIILSICTFSIISCQNKMEEKYSWLATPSAPKEYPMEVYSGALIANDFSYGFSDIWGTQNTGWGNNGGTMNVSTKEMEIPDTLEFTWLSLVEKKMYTGKWKLDKEKIAKLFKEGFVVPSTNKKETYNEFRIGLAPQGRVVLWISGSIYQKEVGFFQAHDTIITQEHAYENAKYMFETNYVEKRLKSDFLIGSDVRERISKYGYPNPDIYNLYREKYPWKLIINLPEGYQLKTGIYLLCNGESGSFNNEKGSTTEGALPYYFSMLIVDKQGKEYGADVIFTKDTNYRNNYILNAQGNVIPIDFDLNEINKVFHEKLSSKEDIEFIINIEPQKEDIEIILKQQGNSFPLTENYRLIF